MTIRDPLKFVIPKGSLEQATVDLFRRAGWNITISPRSYFPDVDDDEIQMARLRAQEIARYVEAGTFDAGLTGKDWILENRSDVKVVDNLVYSKVSQNPARWVLAVDGPSGRRVALPGSGRPGWKAHLHGACQCYQDLFRRTRGNCAGGVLLGQH